MDDRSPVTIFDSADSGTYFRFIGKNFQDLRKFRFALRNFVINSLRTRYRRSFLGFLWSLLNPLLFMVVLAIVFSFAFKQDIKTYSIYVFSGLIPWLYINQCMTAGTQALINAEGYLKKVYIPKLLFPLSLVTTETVNFALSIVSLYLLVLIVGMKLSWTIVFLPLVIMITFVFNLAWVLILSILTIYFRDLSHIIVIIMQALFYLVPVVYPVDILETMPQGFRWIFVYNPLYYFINLFRKVIYGQPAMTPLDWIIPIGLALVSIALGLFILMKRDRKIIFRL